MSLEAWQRELRRQYGRAQRFQVENLGQDPVFSDFAITNPVSKRTYQVTLRGARPGENRCSCPDFAVNELGTCKHVEFLLGRFERRGKKRLLARGQRPGHSELVLRYGAQRAVVFRPGFDCPEALGRQAARFFGEDGALRDEALFEVDGFLQAAARAGHELRSADDALAFLAERRDGERRRAALARRFPRGADSPAFEKLLKLPLMPYQRMGALFAARAGRCLIGDEMGLGKTVQALAAVEILAREAGVERAIIVCPASLKHQWQAEIERFTGRTAEVVGGLTQARREAYARPSFYKIVNYDVVHRDLDAISAFGPEVVILDEAQRIKNWRTRVAASVKRLESPFAFVLTGTPLENRLEELYSIVQFVDRYRLGPLYRFLAEHQRTDEHGKVVGYRGLDRVGQTLQPVLIRRTKAQVALELPARIENRYLVPLSPEQRVIHEENREIVARIVAKWRRYKFLSEADQRRLTCALQNMRMVCDSTYLVDKRTDCGRKVDELVQILDEALADPEAKAVVFSQWLRMHELIARRLQEHGWGHLLFHGGVPSVQRGELVRRFREDPGCRVFLATDAGGTGLNLQHASVVVHVDLPWNPAVLEQRVGRVHRLGQKRPVQVMSLVGQGAIEEGLLTLLAFKKALFAGVLDGGEAEVFLGGSRLQKFMESVEQATGTIPPVEAEESRADAASGREEARPGEEPEGPPPAGASAEAAPAGWLGALEAGALLLQGLGRALGGGDGQAAGRPRPMLLEPDPATGGSLVRLPGLRPEAAAKLADGLRLLAEALTGAAPPPRQVPGTF
jgi:superfamily II DNA or RNA helicase